MARQHEMVVRVAAAQAAIDRFNGRAFAWGSADCGRLAALVLKGMGHKVSVARFGAYSSELGARRALKRQGFDSLEATLDAFPLMRIGHASARVGDLVGLKGEGGWLAIAVAVGNGRIFGFHEGFGRVLHPIDIETAWRVPCR